MAIKNIIYIAVAVICNVGYGLNVYKLSECDFEAPYEAEVIHGAGLIPVIGMVTGWLDVGK